MFKLRHSAVIAMAGFLVGCSSDDEMAATRTVTGGIAPRPLPGCEGESYTPCDVDTVACQEAVFSTVACLRGSPQATRPRSRTLTASAYGAELAASFQNEDAVVTLAYEKALVLLNLASAGDLSVESRVGVSTSTVPASYNWQTKQVTFVMPDGETKAQRKESAYILLAHEYVHAIQDEEHDLGQVEKDHSASTDSGLAVRSLIEGEAVLHEDSFMAASWGIDPESLDWDARYAALRAFDAEALTGIAPFLGIWRSWPYEAGGIYVRNVMKSGGMLAIRALFDNPPEACLTVTAGVDTIPVGAAAPQPPAGYEALDADTFGSELLYDTLSKVASISSTNANRLAADWRGDRVYFYRNPTTAHVAVLWRLRFASEASKDIILSATSAWQSAAVEGDVILGLSTDPNRNLVLTALFDNAKNGVTVPADNTTDGTTQAARLPRLLELTKPN